MSENEAEKQSSDATSDEQVGVGISMGEPNTFEPEEDPDAAPEPGGATPE